MGGKSGEVVALPEEAKEPLDEEVEVQRAASFLSEQKSTSLNELLPVPLWEQQTQVEHLKGPEELTETNTTSSTMVSVGAQQEIKVRDSSSSVRPLIGSE